MKKQIVHLTAYITLLSLMGCSDNISYSQDQESINQEPVVENPQFDEVVINEIKNESGEVIGTYAVVDFNGAQINQNNLVSFYEDVVKDSEHEWVTLELLAKTGIVFSNAENLFKYGIIDQDGTIFEYDR